MTIPPVPFYPLAAQLDAIPIVANPTDRAARFPNPNTNQRVFTVSTLSYDRYDGTSWATDFVAPGSSIAQTFNGFLTAASGLAITGPGLPANYPDYLILNALRTFGGAVGMSLYGSASNGANDTRLVNDGNGNTILYAAGLAVLSVDVLGNITMLGGANTVFYGQIGGHQQVDGWSVTNPAANLTNSLLARSPSFYPAGPGYLTGVGVRVSPGTVTGATGTVTVYKNAVATTLTASVLVSNAFGSTSLQYPTPISSLVAFNAGDLLDVRLTTPAGWTYTTGTLTATLEIIT